MRLAVGSFTAAEANLRCESFTDVYSVQMTRRIATLLLVLVLGGCAVAPFDVPREASYALDPATETHLKREVDEWLAVNDGPSGFYPLVSGNDAFGARLFLIERAEKSLDIQYFLMKPDTAGLVFAGSLLQAAERGVRIRFLLDDIFSTVEDEELELLDAHPNIEIRLYNPIARKGIGIFNYLSDFKRANRRMHNKSFTADNQVTIVGGRNIADEYFELRPEGEFLDLDVLAIGPVAAEVSDEFDAFWNHGRALPLSALVPQFSAEELAEAKLEIDEEVRTLAESAYETAIGSRLVDDLINGRRKLYSAESEVITDDPSKLVQDISDDTMILARRLEDVVEQATDEVIVFTPYFVPMDEGVEFWSSVAAKGVRVVLVTNSLASNNHTAVHSAYSGYRKRIIEAGIELYEVRADAVERGEGVQAESLTLHTKGMIIDREIVFIGSLNLDPRSIEINSEMGLVIHSKEMAAEMADASDERVPEIAYRVDLDERGRIRWQANIDGRSVVEHKEPLTTGWTRFKAFLLRIVPDSQL